MMFRLDSCMKSEVCKKEQLSSGAICSLMKGHNGQHMLIVKFPSGSYKIFHKWKMEIIGEELKRMNKSDIQDFNNDMPKNCSIDGCKNKPRYKNKLTPLVYEWVCRKHYDEYVRGITKWIDEEVLC